MSSYRAEIQAEASREWHSNGFRFATESEAADYLSGLPLRWSTVAKTRVVPSDDPVNYRYVNGRLVATAP